MSKENLTVINTDVGEIKLSPQIVKQYLVSGDGNVSDQEVAFFIALCKYQKLNPFIREAYLVKYGSSPAQVITGKEVFTKRASKIKDCKGWQAGVSFRKDGLLERREGTLILDDEELVGGWCTVLRKDWDVPMKSEVSLKEFNKGRSTWKTMPATMIRKVAIVSALREVFPEMFEGLYDQSESSVGEKELPSIPIKIDDNDIEIIENANVKPLDIETKAERLKDLDLSPEGYEEDDDQESEPKW